MHCLQASACMQNFKKIYQAEVPQILIPKFFLYRDDDEYRRSELRKTLELEKMSILQHFDTCTAQFATNQIEHRMVGGPAFICLTVAGV